MLAGTESLLPPGTIGIQKMFTLPRSCHPHSLELQVCKQYLFWGQASMNRTYFGQFGAPRIASFLYSNTVIRRRASLRLSPPKQRAASASRLGIHSSTWSHHGNSCQRERIADTHAGAPDSPEQVLYLRVYVYTYISNYTYIYTRISTTYLFLKQLSAPRYRLWGLQYTLSPKLNSICIHGAL